MADVQTKRCDQCSRVVDPGEFRWQVRFNRYGGANPKAERLSLVADLCDRCMKAHHDKYASRPREVPRRGRPMKLESVVAA